MKAKTDLYCKSKFPVGHSKAEIRVRQCPQSHTSILSGNCIYACSIM